MIFTAICRLLRVTNLRFSTCLTLLSSYSMYLQVTERSLNESGFSLFWQKENFILPFAVNVMLNLSIIEPPFTKGFALHHDDKTLSVMRARKSFVL